MRHVLLNGGLMHLQASFYAGQPAQSVQADVSRNFLLFIEVHGPFYFKIQSIVIQTGFYGSITTGRFAGYRTSWGSIKPPFCQSMAHM